MLRQGLSLVRLAGAKRWKHPWAGITWCCAVIVVSGLLFPPAPAAQELETLPGGTDEKLLFQEIPSVYGASKYDQKVTEAPSSVSIITSSDIRTFGYRTLADVLRSIRSFYATNDRNYTYAGVRGFARPGDYNSRILLLIDGHRANDNIYDGALIGTEAVIDVDLIDRIEVIRGPGSSLYGSNAFFAVVNVITKRGRSLKGSEVSGEAASFETYKGRLSYGQRMSNGIELLLSATGYTSEGQHLYFPEFDAPATNNGITDNTDYDRFQSVFSKASYGDVTLSAAYSSRTKGIPTASFGTDFNDPGNRTEDNRGYLDLKYQRKYEGGADLMMRLYYDYYEYTGDYIYAGVVNRDWSSGAWGGGEAKYAGYLGARNRIIIGVEYLKNLKQDQQNYDKEPYQLYLDDQRRSSVAAVYLQDELKLSGTFTLNAGVRYDRYSTFGGEVNPRAGLIHALSDTSSIKLLYGRAFRAPNTYELYYFTPLSSKANPDLNPEKIRTHSLVYERYTGSGVRATVSAFYYKIKDLITQTEDPNDLLLVYQNIDSVDARGAEIEVEKRWAAGLEGRVSYTVTIAENEQTGERLTNSPAHMAKLNIAAPFLRRTLHAGIEEQYVSRRRTLSGNYTGSAFTTNVTVWSDSLLKGLDLSFSIYNLLDKHYGVPGSGDHDQDVIVQDGRTFRVKVTYSF